MSGLMEMAFVVTACALGGIAVGIAVSFALARRARARRKAIALGADLSKVGGRGPSEMDDWTLAYAERLARRLFTEATEPINPNVRAKRAGKTRAGAAYRACAGVAGCSKDVTVSAFCEARTRLTLVGAAAGSLLGALLSTEATLVFGLAGAALCRALPMLAVRRRARQRALGAELHLSEMLEVVALGLRSGMTFDRSFALYGAHFDNEFARSCVKAHRRWTLGFATREEALHDLAGSYDCEQLSRVVDSIVRSLRFGSALAGILEEASAQSRASYRATLEEKVAKAPVKMMLPTGTLILPAMLLLVMGPILLELAAGF